MLFVSGKLSHIIIFFCITLICWIKHTHRGGGGKKYLDYSTTTLENIYINYIGMRYIFLTWPTYRTKDKFKHAKISLLSWLIRRALHFSRCPLLVTDGRFYLMVHGKHMVKTYRIFTESTAASSFKSISVS